MMAEDFREVLYTVDKLGRRRWVYSSVVKGRLYRYRLVVAYILMALYLLMPWITINGRQGILLDFIHQRFVFFGVEFWSTETYFLFLLLGILAFSLFFFTALLGRVWCGWACPETVFLEFLFRPIERLIEGTPARRRRLDESPWGFEKIWRKALKHGLCAFCAWVIATSTMAYFVGREPMLAMMSDWPHKNPGAFLVTLVLMGLMGFQFGWFREQFCTILCPYARFQGVLMDRFSVVVGYDVFRGEPRGKLSREASEKAISGDCVDCGLCVRVCPTGIDIRNGLQLECVACTACIDACDSVMSKLGRAVGLIRYDTEESLSAGKRSRRVIRPRTVLYGLLLLIFIVVFCFLLLKRPLTEFQVLRGGLDAPYAELEDGRISNHLHVRVSNKSRESKEYRFMVGENTEVQLITPLSPFPVPGERMLTVPLFAAFSRDILDSGRARIMVILVDDGGEKFSQKVTLLGPDERARRSK